MTAIKCPRGAEKVPAGTRSTRKTHSDQRRSKPQRAETGTRSAGTRYPQNVSAEAHLAGTRYPQQIASTRMRSLDVSADQYPFCGYLRVPAGT